ncbi:Tautomerase/MIF superfamily [Mycotypha africana]|uniref:Tautomerase/MIF superfamily n=1 Tax=Mycotypha africana TaxID=64632 RepID=UPI0023007881|nr:Tautomerase/MIF superfamily [Mycotypha africana]KAI8979607.1 Tautomerase/MIF superfamily [Mycotypha africana]
MPILEIYSAQAPKDIRGFTKRMNATFAELIGKPESFCMVTFSKVDSLFFAGSDEPGFLVKVGSIGHIDNNRNAKLTATVTAELEKELGVQDNRGYFIFTDVPAENIGFKKNTFANLIKRNHTQSVLF